MNSSSCPPRLAEPNVEVFRLKDVIGTCEALSPLAARRVSHSIGVPNSDDPEHRITPGAAIAIWTADLIERLPLQDAEQRWLIVNEFGKEFVRYGNDLWRCLEGRDPRDAKWIATAQLGLADRRYLVFTGVPQLLDLATGLWEEPANIPPVLERILYDLGRLFTHRYSQVAGKCPSGIPSNNACATSGSTRTP